MSANTKASPDLTVRGPAGIVSIIPHLCGFTPSESVVLVFMQGGQISLTQRIDVDLIDADPDTIYKTVAAGVHHGPDKVAAIIWSERPDVMEGSVRLARAIEQTDVYLLDVLHVRADRWRSLSCDDPSCCPPEGHEIDHYSNEVATMTALGSAPAPSREAALVDLTPSSTERTRVQRFANREHLLAWRESVIADPFTLRPALLAAALHDIRIRDTIIRDLCEKGWTEESVDAFAAATRASHPSDAAPAAVMFAIACWQNGGGPNVYEGTDVATKADPDYSMTPLVEVAARAGMPPTVYRETMLLVPREVCLHGGK